MEQITFEELRNKALLEGVADNKVSIGLYAKIKGYIKKRKQVNKKVTIYYLKIQ